MKKLLLLAGILVVGATSFAEGVQEKQYVQQDKNNMYNKMEKFILLH